MCGKLHDTTLCSDLEESVSTTSQRNRRGFNFLQLFRMFFRAPFPRTPTLLHYATRRRVSNLIWLEGLVLRGNPNRNAETLFVIPGCCHLILDARDASACERDESVQKS